MSQHNITKDILITLIDLNYSTYGLAEQLKCSQTNVRYYLRKFGLNTNSHAVKNIIKECIVCTKSISPPKIKFCSEKCSSEHKSNNRNSYNCQQVRGNDRKLKLIKYKGGCCEICGYSKNYAALLFHHLIPENKLFCINLRKCSNTNMKSLYIEVDKCQLLCHNCHYELHYPECLIV